MQGHIWAGWPGLDTSIHWDGAGGQESSAAASQRQPAPQHPCPAPATTVPHGPHSPCILLNIWAVTASHFTSTKILRPVYPAEALLEPKDQIHQLAQNKALPAAGSCSYHILSSELNSKVWVFGVFFFFGF